MTEAERERAAVMAWLRSEAAAERALAEASVLNRRRGHASIPDRIRMKALAYEEAADAIEARAHLSALDQEGGAK